MRNLGQMRCAQCGQVGGYVYLHECLTDAEWKGVKSFASTSGERWRSQLRKAWLAGSDVLPQLRTLVGPDRLHEVKPDDLRAMLAKKENR